MDSRDHRFFLSLELLAGLRVTPAHWWTFEEWWAVLRPLEPRVARVVVFRVIFGLTKDRIGELLEISRGRVLQLWQDGIRRLAKSIDRDKLCA